MVPALTAFKTATGAYGAAAAFTSKQCYLVKFENAFNLPHLVIGSFIPTLYTHTSFVLINVSIQELLTFKVVRMYVLAPHACG